MKIQGATSGRRFKEQLQDEDSRNNFRKKIQGATSGRRFKEQLQDEEYLHQGCAILRNKGKGPTHGVSPA